MVKPEPIPESERGAGPADPPRCSEGLTDHRPVPDGPQEMFREALRLFGHEERQEEVQRIVKRMEDERAREAAEEEPCTCELDLVDGGIFIWRETCPRHGAALIAEREAREAAVAEVVDHPAHYGGEADPFETIKVLAAWLSPEELRGFARGNALKYLSRAGRKGSLAEDARKAEWYARYLAEIAEAEASASEGNRSHGGAS